MGVGLGGEPGGGDEVVVGVAEVVGPVHVGAAKGFGDQVHGLRGAVAELGQVVAFQNVERAEQDDSAGGGRRGADDGVVVEGAGDGRALDDIVLGEVVEGEQGAALAELVDQFVGQLAVVEVLGVVGDALEGAGELGLAEGFALLIEMAVALEDALRVGKPGEVGVAEFAGLLGGEDEALGGELDGRGHDAGEAELAVLALGVDHAGDGAGGGDGAVADDTGLGGGGDDVAFGVLIHGFGGVPAGLFRGSR